VNTMSRLLKFLDGLCIAGAGFAALCCLALAVMLIIEVIATSFFSYSQPWAVEYSGYLLAPTLFAGAGWTLSRGGHIRVAVIIDALPERAERFLDLVMSVFALGVTLYVCWAVSENAVRSFERGSFSTYPTATPIWLPQTVLAAGWWLLTVGLVTRVIRRFQGVDVEDTDTPDLDNA